MHNVRKNPIHTAAIAAAVAIAALFMSAVATAPAYASASDVKHIFDATNNHRSSHCISQLRSHKGLDSVAQDWAKQMSKNGKLEHNPKAGEQIPSGWKSWGENVAFNRGFSDPSEKLMSQWKNSQGHNLNMLREGYTHVGVGFYTDSSGRSWGVQLFATYSGFSTIAPNSSTGFCDVPDSHPFAADIQWLADSGVTGGYSDGTFRPGGTVTRQALAAFLYRIAGEPSFRTPSSATFKDVPRNHQFFKEVEWLASTGITSGYSDKTFRPGDTVTRQAMAAFLYRFAGEPAFSAPSKASFKDVKTSHPFFKDVQWLTHVGITTGYKDGTFGASSSVSRQAMAAFLSRFESQFGGK